MARIRKKKLWRDILATFRKSKGRFFSIVCLIALGSFALVGLKVAGPDMRETSSGYFASYDMADLAVIGDLGIDGDDEADIEQVGGLREVEYGYLKDVTIKDTNDAVRVESVPEQVSQFELVDGRMPTASDEIALDSFMAEDYPAGSTIEFHEKEGLGGSTVLTCTKFTVVGHVASMDIIASVNKGKTTVGTGDLMGYAVVTQDAFDASYHMIARLTFDDTEGLSPYSAEYLEKVSAHKEELNELLSDAPDRRLSTIRGEYDDKIEDGQAKIDDARQQLADAKATLDDAETQLADGQSTLDSSWNTLENAAAKLASARETLASGREQLASAQETLVSTRSTLDSGWGEYNDGKQALASARSDAEAQIAATQQQIDDSRSKLEGGKAAYESGIETLNSTISQLEAGIPQLEQAISDCETAISALSAGITQIDQALADPTITDTQRAQYEAQKAQLEAQKQAAETKKGELEKQKYAAETQLPILKQKLTETQAAYERFMNVDADAEAEGEDGGYTVLISQLDAGQQQLDAKKQEVEAQLSQKESELATAKTRLENGEAAYASGVSTYNSKRSEYEAGVAEYNEGLASYQEGLATYNSGVATLAQKRSEYEDGLAAYNDALPEAEQKIADAEADIADATEERDGIDRPSYDVDTRRETPGAEGYKTYDSVSEIVDSLANIFPYFLYLVAALVASTTMTRMVDEERINAGTLKALGYRDRDVMKKFVVYGMAAGGVGSLVGIALGHTLLPFIVYSAYGAKFSLPPIVLQFHPLVSLAALALGLAVSVVPAVLVAKRSLSEKPAQLLLPKAPASGSKIILEHIRPIWSRLSFTQKVTCRNLLRYKKRMAMTVIGVAGSVCLMFCGFAVRNSIDGLSETQFGDIIRYDLIVAENTHVSDDEQAAIDAELASDAVRDHSQILYESLTKTAGDKGDDQSINLLVPADEETFTKYLSIRDRASGASIALPSDGVVISERLAGLLGVQVGDEITFKDSDGAERSVKVGGICEMYLQHFMFMSPTAYESCFGKKMETNAYVVSLADGSVEGTRAEAAKFMQLDGVLGCVQSATLINQINVIVKSLNMIMGVLIVVAVLLAVVIVYNLVTINVAERIRELSTIKVLGFYDNEVSMYIYRETIINSILSLPVGWLLGWLLQQYIITAVPPEEVMFNPATGWLPYLVSTVVIVAVVAVMYVSVNRKLREVDMLEALKSVD